MKRRRERKHQKKVAKLQRITATRAAHVTDVVIDTMHAVYNTQAQRKSERMFDISALDDVLTEAARDEGDFAKFKFEGKILADYLVYDYANGTWRLRIVVGKHYRHLKLGPEISIRHVTDQIFDIKDIQAGHIVRYDMTTEKPVAHQVGDGGRVPSFDPQRREDEFDDSLTLSEVSDVND